MWRKRNSVAAEALPSPWSLQLPACQHFALIGPLILKYLCIHFWGERYV